MDIEILREFTLLADTCNFQLAAERLDLSQSALSKHIHKLEEELKLDLFDRSKRSVSLNDNGKVFLEFAKRMCKLYDECTYAMNQRRLAVPDIINIGLVKIQDNYGLMEKLTEFGAANPEVHMNVLEQNEEIVKARLTSGEINFAISADMNTFDDKDFEKIAIIDDKLVVLLPEGHPLQDQTEIDIMQISGESFIEHSSHYEDQLIKKITEKYDLKLNIVASVSYSSTILKLIQQGLGISLISDGCTGHYKKYGLIKTDLVQNEGVTIYLVYKRRKVSASGEKFIRYITETLEER